MPLPLTLPACPTLRLTHRSCATHQQLSLPFMIKSLVLHPPSRLCLPTSSNFLAVLIIQLCSSLTRFFRQRLAPFFILFSYWEYLQPKNILVPEFKFATHPSKNTDHLFLLYPKSGSLKHSCSRTPIPSDSSTSLDSLSDSDSSTLASLSEDSKIPKPPGEPRCPGCGGYTLHEALDWSPKAYSKLKVSITLPLIYAFCLPTPQEFYAPPHWGAPQYIKVCLLPKPYPPEDRARQSQ
jgi:hypothetical protein